MKKLFAAVLSAAMLLTLGLSGCGQANKDAKYVILDEALADEEYVIGFRKTDTALKEEVNQVLSGLKADGSLGEISKKWFGSDVTTVPADYEKADAADGSLQKIKDKGQLVLGLDDSFPPMGYRDEDQNIVGFDVDVAKKVCEKLGVELKLQPIKWSSKEAELDTGNVDCLWNGFTKSSEREEKMNLSVPYMTNRQVVVTMDSKGVSSLADLKGKELVLQGGSTAVDALNGNETVKSGLKGGRATEVDDNVTALLDLKTSSAAAVLMDEVVARYYINTMAAK
ncbi:MAG: transporter substrate-binding domain-containing protein [Clostridiales bacterium]|nr:transporter substrate-binding domain-containing protein [Clostridiales bacterium]